MFIYEAYMKNHESKGLPIDETFNLLSNYYSLTGKYSDARSFLENLASDFPEYLENNSILDGTILYKKWCPTYANDNFIYKSYLRNNIRDDSSNTRNVKERKGIHFCNNRNNNNTSSFLTGKFCCQIKNCGRTYSSKNGLNYHLKSTHDQNFIKEKPFLCPCDNCNNRYKTKAALTYHIRHKHN